MINYLQEIFTSTEIWGLIGPLLIVAAGYYIAKRNKNIGGLYLVVIFIAGSYYMNLGVDYAWQFLITVMGGLFVCVYRFFDK